MGLVFEGGRFGRGVHPFRVEVVHFTFYLGYSFLKQYLASNTRIDVPAPRKVPLQQGTLGLAKGR